MLRSLLALVVAVVLGLVAARIVETRAALAGVAPGSGGYLAALVGGWAVGAFVAASAALFVGGRWAPLGWLATATLALNAILSTVGGPAEGAPKALAAAAGALGAAAAGGAAVWLLARPGTGPRRSARTPRP